MLSSIQFDKKLVNITFGCTEFSIKIISYIIFRKRELLITKQGLLVWLTHIRGVKLNKRNLKRKFNKEIRFLGTILKVLDVLHQEIER